MKFFIPKPEKSVKIEEKSLQSSIDSNIKDPQHLTEQQLLKKRKQQHIKLLKEKDEVYNIKLKLKVQEIAISLVNRKTRVMFGKIGLNGFKLDFGQSNKKMDIGGSIAQFYLSDYSNYPNTIIKEQA